MNKLLLLSLIAILLTLIFFICYYIFKKVKNVLIRILSNQEQIKAEQQQIKTNQEQIKAEQQQIKTSQEQLKTSQEQLTYKVILKLKYLRENYEPIAQYVDNFQRQQIRQDNLRQSSIITYKRRNVLFLHNSYYHFYYLAKALRKRGWDAITVSYEDPINGINANYYHGEDINLYDPDPVKFRTNIESFFEEAKSRFQFLNFAGDSLMSFFPEKFTYEAYPEDIIEWRNLGKKVAYTISGCNSATAKSSVAKWSALDNGKVFCDTCVWQERPDICHDEKNLRWGKKVNDYCDLIFAETLPSLDYIDSPKVIREPATMCLDPGFWHPELLIPDKFKISNPENKILIYHSVGNYKLRTRVDGRNIKGTPAILEAIEKLKLEGFAVELIFVTNVKNTEVRYIQAQADIIVDQLNIGRYGAIAREGMMLGKPVVCYINKCELKPESKLSCLEEVPLVSATEESIYNVLKELVLDQEKRLQIGKESRRYALKWHSADACAERYEVIYDSLMEGKDLQLALKTSLSSRS